MNLSGPNYSHAVIDRSAHEPYRFPIFSAL